MNEYAITITETLKKTVYVEADSVETAKDIARNNWKNGEYVLDADDFENVTFEEREEN